MVRCQDYEFNQRIVKNGGKIWMDSKIYSKYYNQPTLKNFYKKQFFKEAPYNPYMWYLAPYTFTFRHAITSVFSAGIFFGFLFSFLITFLLYTYIGAIVIYSFLAMLSAFQQSNRYKDLRLLFILPFCFFSFHFIHGLGVLKGCLLLLFHKSPVQNK